MKQDVELEYSGRIGQALIAGFLFGAFVVFVGWQIIEAKTTPSEPKAHNDIRIDKTGDHCKLVGGLTTIVFVKHDKSDRMTAQCCSNSYPSSKKQCAPL